MESFLHSSFPRVQAHLTKKTFTLLDPSALPIERNDWASWIPELCFLDPIITKFLHPTHAEQMRYPLNRSNHPRLMPTSYYSGSKTNALWIDIWILSPHCKDWREAWCWAHVEHCATWMWSLAPGYCCCWSIMKSWHMFGVVPPLVSMPKELIRASN